MIQESQNNLMKKRSEYKLTHRITVSQVEKWLETGDDDAKNRLTNFIKHRLHERYVKHVLEVPSGFLKMAICCLLIETLQAFKEGLQDTQKQGRIFERFFKENVDLFPGFDDPRLNFFKNIRCAILHQAETRGGWRLIRSGKQIDFDNYSISSWKFAESMQKAIDKYLYELHVQEFDSEIWRKARKKIQAICDNCEIP